MSEVVIRRALLSDIDSLVNVYTDCFPYNGRLSPVHDVYPEPALFCREGMSKLLADKEIEIYCIISNNCIAGSLMCYKSGDEYVTFDNLAVKHPYRGFGYSKKLVGYCAKMYDSSLKIALPVLSSEASQKAFKANNFSVRFGYSLLHYGKVFDAELPESVMIAAYAMNLTGKLNTSKRTIYIYKNYIPYTHEVVQELSPIGGSWDIKETEYMWSDKHGSIDFRELEDYRDAEVQKLSIEVEHMSDYPYAYINVTKKRDKGCDISRFDFIVQSLKISNHHISLRIDVTMPGSLIIAEKAANAGFIFQSFMPFKNPFMQELSSNRYIYDMLSLQWINPYTLKKYLKKFKQKFLDNRSSFSSDRLFCRLVSMFYEAHIS
jgi:hypothetical protein